MAYDKFPMHALDVSRTNAVLKIETSVGRHPCLAVKVSRPQAQFCVLHRSSNVVDTLNNIDGKESIAPWSP